MRRYLRHFQHARRTILVLALALSLLGLLPAASVWVLQHALDGLLAHQPIGRWLLALVAIAALQAAGGSLRARVTRQLSWSLVHRLRARLHKRFHELPVTEAVGSRLAALTHEADELQYGVSALVTIIRAPVSVLGLLFTAGYLAPMLALRFLVVLPIIALAAWAGGRWVRRATSAWRAERSALLTELTDQHNGMQTTQDLGAQQLQQQRMHRLSARESQLRAHLEWVRAVPSTGVELLVVLAIALLLAGGQADLAAGTSTAGALVAFAIAVALLRRPLVQLSEVWSLSQRSIAALQRIDQVLERPPTPQGMLAAAGFVFNGCVPGRLVAQLTIEPGEKLALVGASGSGKSTLLSVLAGRLVFEGSLERSRSQLLRQDPWVFDRSLRENLWLGDPNASEARLREVLKQVAFDEAILRLDEPAGERGGRLSGGERQRLCLARALLGDPQALLLDEATSELDPPHAQRITEHLLQLDCTVVFASHHPWFALHADRVAWFVEGSLVEVASHHTLLQRPAYRAFWAEAA